MRRSLLAPLALVALGAFLGWAAATSPASPIIA